VREGRTLGQITMSSDIENLVIEYDPVSKLIESIVLEVTGGDLVQPEARLTYRHQYKYETFDEALPPERFAFDPGERKLVESLFELLPAPAPRAAGPDDEMAPAGGLVGQPAPPLVLATMDGGSVDLEDLRGRVVVLDFWATWCPPCREEMPSMERLHQEFKDQGLAVLAVNIQESPKQVVRFMKDFRLSFPALLDSDMKVTGLYQVRGLPSTYLVDRNGRVVGQAVGARDWTSPAARALVRSVLSAPTARQ